MPDKRTLPPFRADHVGSLLRPPELREAHVGFKAGNVSEEKLREIQDRAIRDVVSMQERIGLHSITDGEFRRDNWRDRFFESVSGYSAERYDSPFTFTEFSGETHKGMPVPHVVSKLKRMKSMAKDEFAFLKPLVSKTAKLTLPSPITNHFYLGDKIVSQAYGSRAEYLNDIASIYKQELADVAAVGCNYLQLDEVCLAVACDPQVRQIAEKRGEDFNEHASLPRKLRAWDRTRRIRTDCRFPVQPNARRCLFPGIRHGPRGRLHPLTIHAKKQTRCLGDDQHKAQRA